MLKRLDRIDRALAESEVRLAEQVFRIFQMESRGEDTATARKLLRTLETLHVEYVRAREAILEARRLRDVGSRRMNDLSPEP